MREIKFRSWWKHQNKMDYGFNSNGLTIEEFARSYSMPLDWCDIMQYTGLKDKNGKEIYEGDIVKRSDVDEPEDEDCWQIGVVKYGKFNCSCCDGIYGYYFEGADIRDVNNEYLYQVEVIGNIYENPELLND